MSGTTSSLAPGLDQLRQAIALLLTGCAAVTAPLAEDAAELSGDAGDVMGNRHAVPERKRATEGRHA